MLALQKEDKQHKSNVTQAQILVNKKKKKKIWYSCIGPMHHVHRLIGNFAILDNKTPYFVTCNQQTKNKWKR